MTNILNAKMVMIGDTCSGKSSVIDRLIYNKYDIFLNQTNGARFLTKQMGTNYKLEIWDTAGNERYRSLTPMYLRNAVIVCIVISLEKKNYELINDEKQYWLNYLQQNNTMTTYYKKILVYNKSDLNLDFVLQNDGRFDYTCITSCKTNTGIDIFTHYLQTILINMIEDDFCKKISLPRQNKSYSSNNRFMSCCLL